MNDILKKRIEEAAINGSKHYDPNISKYSQGKQVGYIRGFKEGAKYALLNLIKIKHTMANTCTNQMYIYSEDRNNMETIINFFHDWPYAEIEDSDTSADIYFDSKWVFPEEEMNRLYKMIPNKSDIYMRCLSYEFGNLYHALWICDKDGWREV